MSLSLILVLLSTDGCAKKKVVKAPPDTTIEQQNHISRIGRLMATNQTHEAMTACSSFFEKYPRSPILDHALFECGLVYTSEPGEDRGYTQALTYLNRVSEVNPLSPYADSARTLASLVNTMVKLQGTYTQQTNQLQACQNDNATQSKTVKDLLTAQAQQQKTIRDLQNEIEKIKRIDLNKHP